MLSFISDLFSSAWYLSQNPDVHAFQDGPEAHYMSFGWREGRSPHPLFDTAYYHQQVRNLHDIDLEPSTHYLNSGWHELLSPHPLFDPAWYLTENPDLISANIDPWWHYIQKGWKEARSLHPLFDTQWYLNENTDVAAIGIEPLGHYLSYGWREGRKPHPMFDGEWYSSEYNLDDDTNPWLDYITSGWKQMRQPHPEFDAQWYHQNYLDAETPICDPLHHFVSKGWQEKLLPNKGFVIPENANFDELPTLRAATKSLVPNPIDLSASGSRGRIILVTHDAQLGGAQKVLMLLANWIKSSTRFSVGIVAVNGGHFLPEFEAIAPVFVLSSHPEAERAEALKAWAYDGAASGVTASFVNSIASGSFYKYWPKDIPSVAFIHELQQILDLYPNEVALVKEHADHIVCGGPDVMVTLEDDHNIPRSQLSSSYSFIEALADDDARTDQASRRRAARDSMEVPDDQILVMGCGVAHWRKSPDKFVETAIQVLEKGVNARFVWLGGGPDEEACIAQATAAGIQDRVTFAGYEPDVAGKIAGADIFLLSSQEDPFPLVALYAAQASVPIICFKDAGGIQHFVESGSGISVPFMDIDAMSAAVEEYAQDPALRASAGEIGRQQILARHTINTAGPFLLDKIRSVACISPEVSVVLPNYNYEDYLHQRLDTITAQSFQDFEIILLDDASTDESPALLSEFAASRAATQISLNNSNSGSPFKQWMRGMEMAKSDIIWLAEADDYCEPDLLATLLPMFDDQNMRLASSMSVPVQADGTVIGDYRPIYLDRIAPGRFDTDYIATDHEEASHGLGIANTIPNASAVMFRRFEAETEFVDTVTNMRLCGDWFFYTRAMKGGYVGFSAVPLNYHRRHDKTVTHSLEGSLRYFEELADVRSYLGQTYSQSEPARNQIQTFLDQDIIRFNVDDASTLAKAPAPQKTLPSLLVVAPDLSPGGGQMFAISLANEWAARGGRVVLFNAFSQPTHPAVLAKLKSDIAYYEHTPHSLPLNEIVERYDIDVIHSSIWWADSTVDDYRDTLPAGIPWIISMHGCHETFIQDPDIDTAFPEKMQRMLDDASAWVYTADKNLKIFDSYPKPKSLFQIPNGMPVEPVSQVLDRSSLGIRENATVLCLASRAIPSKGWGEAVELTKMLNAQGHEVDLMLIGEGPSADELRATQPDNVHLMGQVSNLQDHLAIADIGLLPSYFVGESLPLVLIEMLAKGLPLIATNIGEIKDILGEGKDAAGTLIPLNNGDVDMEALLKAAQAMLTVDNREKFSVQALKRFETYYKLSTMVDRYAALYNEAGALTWKNIARSETNYD